METTEALSKAEYQYLRTIEKSEELITKLETALQKEKSANEQLAIDIEILKSASEKSVKECTELTSVNEKLISALEETTKECQTHIDDIETQNDVLEKQNAELKMQVLPKEEMQFYYGCKADIILAELHHQKKTFTIEELKEKNFPVVLLKAEGEETSGIETTNFLLKKDAGETEYQLSKK